VVVLDSSRFPFAGMVLSLPQNTNVPFPTNAGTRLNQNRATSAISAGLGQGTINDPVTPPPLWQGWRPNKRHQRTPSWLLRR
jgi:hypothetical protein